ncbi:hypothetical protein PVBG_03303 [Plasmodium vivax Brazil I]|uniref:Uncharacterized protein n=1 Tax=Plasmodium vivax (strain Brazil I) TaxID=1033975 RepID=A0A0J9T4L4_PLAV1|nr:hypothetical protein PVBG_03303 [Plasmodium vivax Brazil I]
MVEVYFEVPTGKEKLDTSACVDIYFNFIDDINYKIAELEKTQGENHIHNKCQEIDQYLREHKYNHNECYGDNFKRYVRNLEGEANTLLSKSNVYSQYCISSTSKGEEHTKPKVATEELGEEKGKPASERPPVKNPSQRTSSCSANQTDGPGSSTGSATITSRFSEGTTVTANSPSAVSAASELDKDHSDAYKGKDSTLKEVSAAYHLKTEESESHTNTPSPQSISFQNSNSTVNLEEYTSDLRSFAKKYIINYKNDACTDSKGKSHDDSNEENFIVKLTDCTNEDVEYTIRANSDHENDRAAESFQTNRNYDIPPLEPHNKGHTLMGDSYLIPSKKILENGESTGQIEYAQVQIPGKGQETPQEPSYIRQTLHNEQPIFLQEKERVKCSSNNLHTCNEINYKESHKNLHAAGSDIHSVAEPKGNGIAVKYFNNALDSNTGIANNGYSILETTDTVPEEPSLKMYTTIIAMILGGILFFALLSKVKISILY